MLGSLGKQTNSMTAVAKTAITKSGVHTVCTTCLNKLIQKLSAQATYKSDCCTQNDKPKSDPYSHASSSSITVWWHWSQGWKVFG